MADHLQNQSGSFDTKGSANNPLSYTSLSYHDLFVGLFPRNYRLSQEKKLLATLRRISIICDSWHSLLSGLYRSLQASNLIYFLMFAIRGVFANKPY